MGEDFPLSFGLVSPILGLPALKGLLYVEHE